MNRSILTVSLALAIIGSVTPSSGGQRAIANKAVVRGYLTEVLNGKQWELWDRYFSSSVTFNGSAISREWIVAMSNALHSAFPDLLVSIEEQIAEADLVATRVTFRGTHLGEYRGIAATGRRIEYSGIAFDRIADGKIVEMWHQADASGLLDQIRAEEP